MTRHIAGDLKNWNECLSVESTYTTVALIKRVAAAKV